MIQHARSVVWWLAILGGATVFGEPVVVFPKLPAAMEAGWNEYVAATNQRINTEKASPSKFLALDFAATADADRRAILAGQMPVASMHTTGANGRDIQIPGAWVHHWRGAVLLPHARLEDVFNGLRERVPGSGHGEILESRILARNGLQMRVFIKVQRTFVLTVVYDTEHAVTFIKHDPKRMSSTSVAVKIAQVSDPGTPKEHELAQGADDGYLWRWNSSWRYEQVAEGVIAECESLSLSYEPAWALRGIGRELSEVLAKESMEHALVSLRTSFAAPASLASPTAAPTADRTPLAWSPVR